MSMTAVPISMRLVRAPTAASRGKGRGELAREVMHAEVRAVHAQALGFDGEVDGLQERVGGGLGCGLRGGRPVAEGEEADFLHAGLLMRASSKRCFGHEGSVPDSGVPPPQMVTVMSPSVA
jgi:hypothetical protein